MILRNAWKCLMLGTLLAGSAVSSLHAAENGNTQYSPGSAQFYAGGVPPFSGFYLLSQTSYFTSDRMNDGDGNKQPFEFKVRSIADTFRLLYVSDINIAGAQVWGQLVVPVVHLDLDLPFGDGNNLNIADITGTIGLAWHLDRYNSIVFGIDVGMPTGYYSASDVASIGLNHWSVQPTLGYHYSDPQGLELATTARLIFNTRNNDTDYKTGTEFVLDYAVGWNIDKWRIGAVGYYLQQLTDDTGPTAAADGHRGKGFALGPSLTYSFTPATQVSASWQHDIVAENRAQGNTVWLNFATKF